MNRGYNLLAFPHGGYLIREKEGGVDTGEDNGPSEAPDQGERAGGAWKYRKIVEFDNRMWALAQDRT